MRRLGSLIALGFSLGMHLAFMATLGSLHYSTQQSPPDLLIKAAFSDGREEQFYTNCSIFDMTAEKNARAAAARQEAIRNYHEPSEVTGCDPERPFSEVLGYGATFPQITQELVRLMRQDPLLVVWLFDESQSMQDDLRKIAPQLLKVYEDLAIAAKQENRQGTQEIRTAITGFGEKFSVLTPSPTSNIAKIRAAFDKISVDESGIENSCLAINSALRKFGPLAEYPRRQLVLVLVTDESGDDAWQVDATVKNCRKQGALLYVVGRAAVFGHPTAQVRWKDPKFDLEHSLPLRRGPETPFPETLQWDGLQVRNGTISSGFPPYEQFRMALYTGGVFFILADEESSVDHRSAELRRYDALDMKEYAPSLKSRQDYQRERAASVFRSAVGETIVRLDPHEHPELNIQQENYPTDREGFAKVAGDSFERALSAMQTLEAAITTLEKVRPLRDQEASMRWRANFDLILAQCLAYRVRLYQLCLALDQHQRNFPAPSAPHHNVWNIEHVSQTLPADPRATPLKGIDLQQLADQERQARAMFQFVQTTHPGTPWAVRAAAELAKGFGFRFVSDFRDPRYDDLVDTKFPRQ